MPPTPWPRGRPDAAHRPSGAYGADVVVLAGSGNNGGDALHAGALLRARGARVTAVLTGSEAHEEGLAALRGAGGFVLGLGRPARRRAPGPPSART
ncbi:Uncharacterized conserved protein [Rothia kristinae]|nr:Uncharacterized conserved protein [Rothia kristinae]